jgi:hypothetical protein
MTIKIRAVNQEDDYLSFQIYGPDASGLIRLAVVETTIREYQTPEDWLDANSIEAQALIDTGRHIEEFAAKVDLQELQGDATTEIAWLEENIPLVDSADLTTLRSYIRRLMSENLRQIEAWRFVAHRLAE